MWFQRKSKTLRAEHVLLNEEEKAIKVSFLHFSCYVISIISSILYFSLLRERAKTNLEFLQESMALYIENLEIFLTFPKVVREGVGQTKGNEFAISWWGVRVNFCLCLNWQHWWGSGSEVISTYKKCLFQTPDSKIAFSSLVKNFISSFSAWNKSAWINLRVCMSSAFPRARKPHAGRFPRFTLQGSNTLCHWERKSIERFFLSLFVLCNSIMPSVSSSF